MGRPARILVGEIILVAAVGGFLSAAAPASGSSGGYTSAAARAGGPSGGYPSAAAPASGGYLRTDGSRIVDAAGRPVVLSGVNWFGLETPTYAPHGLGVRSWQSLLDQIVDLGFNAVRLPYSNQLFEPDSLPNGIDLELNPELQGLSGLEIMDRVIQGAGERGLVVIVDRHRPGSQAQSELWYTSQYSEQRWIEDWVMLARRYAGNPTVVGVDLHNEPRGPATWGTGETDTDWRLAAERAGNAILEVNPDLLVIVQGVDQYDGNQYWWGGSLAGVREHPVRLDLPDRLVYSTHDYGPGVYPQPWFSDPGFPDNLAGIWYQHWAFLHLEGLAPVLVGEFGGRSVGEDAEGVWQRTLIEYLHAHQISRFYWSLNPNSGDTGGILLDDWRTVDAAKAAALAPLQAPLLADPDQPAPSREPTDGPASEQPATPSPPAQAEPSQEPQTERADQPSGADGDDPEAKPAADAPIGDPEIERSAMVIGAALILGILATGGIVIAAGRRARG